MRITKRNNHIVATGTSRRGTLKDTSFDELVKEFGEPLYGSEDGKVQATWILQFEDGEVVTIYDYKRHTPVQSIKNWSIGGNNNAAVFNLRSIFGDRARTYSF